MFRLALLLLVLANLLEIPKCRGILEFRCDFRQPSPATQPGQFDGAFLWLAPDGRLGQALHTLTSIDGTVVPSWELETDDPFHAETTERLYRYIYSAGGTRKPVESYRSFRGRDPLVEAMLVQEPKMSSLSQRMLRKRGLISNAS